jgi:hypothetical protein
MDWCCECSRDKPIKRNYQINSVNDAVQLLQTLSTNGYNSSENLTTNIMKLYYLNPPNMEKLSLLQQSVQNTGGIEEYAIVTLYICALQYIMETTQPNLQSNLHFVSKKDPITGIIEINF